MNPPQLGYPATTSNTFTYPPQPGPDLRDMELMRLRTELASKDIALKECYCEIGRLHEQLRGLTAFDKWSEGMAAQKNAP
jgi:hypothetical protein